MLSPSTLLAPEPVLHRVSLRTRDADRLGRFYDEVLRFGHSDVFTLAEDRSAQPAPHGAPGLFHTAVVFPEVESWAAAVRRAVDAGAEFHGASDHAVSWAAYFADPDGNGLELAWDTPPVEWPWQGDRVQMVTRALPLRSILAQAAPERSDAPRARLGHLHLQIADLADAEAYGRQLDLRVTQDSLSGARFLARGRYHHHLGLNTWRTDGRTPRPENAVGLMGWEMTAGNQDAGPWIDPAGHRVELV